MNINLDYKIPDNERGGFSNAELTRNYLLQAVAAVHPQGIGGQKNRIWGRIQRKVDDAIDEKKDTIDLEKAEIEFLRKDVFSKDPTVHPAASKYFTVLEDEIDSLE